MNMVATLAVFSLVALWASIERFRFGRRRPAISVMVIGLALALCSIATFWLVAEDPNTNFWVNQGFGVALEYIPLGKNAAEAYIPDVPARLRQSVVTIKNDP